MPVSSQLLPEGTVTVMCTDLVGSTSLNQKFEDVAATAIQREISKRSSELVTKHGGAVFKDTGDGLIAAFQSARRAVACAEEIQRALARQNRQRPDAPVRLRIGLQTGEVLEDDGDLHGETVIISKASRRPPHLERFWPRKPFTACSAPHAHNCRTGDNSTSRELRCAGAFTKCRGRRNQPQAPLPTQSCRRSWAASQSARDCGGRGLNRLAPGVGRKRVILDGRI